MSLEGDSWTKRTARIGFPILVEFARARREITYSEWDSEIVRRRLGGHVLHMKYGWPAGAIGDACQEYSVRTGVEVPAINLMVVNKRTRVPGRGADRYILRFCREFLDRTVESSELTVREKRAIIERALEEIFDFPAWGDVLSAFGLEAPAAEPSTGRPSGVRRRPRPSRWRTGPESEAHKTLKESIAANPSLIGLSTDEIGTQEHSLWSGDRVDVHFQQAAVAVEVKPAGCSFDELHRGIFQCVKYKAVLRAQQVHESEIPTADCVLAAGGDVSKKLREVTDLFGVRIFAGLGQ